MRPKFNPYKGLASLPTQNLKTMNLRVLILIWCSTFSFLFNVTLRLTLGFPTICPSNVSLGIAMGWVEHE